jgi:Ca2+/Na+ antiporter
MITANPPSLPEIERHLEDILGRPEFQERGPSLFERILNAIVDFFTELFSKLGQYSMQLGVWAYVLLVLLLAVLVFLLIVLIKRHKRRDAGQKKSQPFTRQKRMTAIELLAQADALARAGSLEAAVASLMAALLTRLQECKLIKLEQGRTNRQYLSDLKRTGYQGAEAFAAFSSIFASWRYGGQPVTIPQYDSWRQALIPLFEKELAA